MAFPGRFTNRCRNANNLKVNNSIYSRVPRIFSLYSACKQPISICSQLCPAYIAANTNEDN